VRAFKPDITYARTFTWAPGYLGAIAPKGLVIEINTNDEVESRNYPLAKRVLYRESMRRLFRRADAFVAVTPDLAEHVAPYGKPAMCIGNGISPGRYDASIAASQERTRSVLFVGTPGQSWHGIDRVLMLAQAMPQVTFHVAGYSDGHVYPNVIYHGLLDATSLGILYSRCSVGLGSLAMERVDMSYSSSLKVREYLACGLPVLLESPDADLENLDGVSLVRWGTNWVERASCELERLMTTFPDRVGLRERALQRCGSEAVERRRLDFVSSIERR
jgi:glycosyltransferase involved in cell wall biosynthesis